MYTAIRLTTDILGKLAMRSIVNHFQVNAIYLLTFEETKARAKSLTRHLLSYIPNVWPTRT